MLLIKNLKITCCLIMQDVSLLILQLFHIKEFLILEYIEAYRRGRRLPANKEIAYVVQVNHAKKYSRKEYREGKQFSEAFFHTVELVQGFIDGGLGSNPGETFGEFFSELMSERKITVKQLADKTDIPERTIIRMRTEDDYKPSIEYLIACCIVMQLPPWDSDTLFELAGIKLRPNNKKERCYIALLHVFFQEGSIRVCDEVLTRSGLPTLSSVINRNKKNK